MAEVRDSILNGLDNSEISNLNHIYSVIIEDFLELNFLQLASKDNNNKDSKNLTISKRIFADYFCIPIFVSNTIFDAINFKMDDNVLNCYDFIKGINNLYFGSLDGLLNLTFKIYSLGNKGKIYKIKVLFLLNSLNKLLENSFFGDLQTVVDKFFNNEIHLNLQSYKNIIYSSNSDIFVLILAFLNILMPFNTHAINILYKFKIRYDDRKFNASKYSVMSKKYFIDRIFRPSQEIISFLKRNFEIFLPSVEKKVAKKNVLKFQEISSKNVNEKFYELEDEYLEIYNCIPRYKDSCKLLKYPVKLFIEDPENCNYFDVSILNSKRNRLLKYRLLFEENFIFSFEYSSSSNDFDLKSILNLNSYFPYECQSLEKNGIVFYSIALINKYSNSYANIKNIFLLMTD